MSCLPRTEEYEISSGRCIKVSSYPWCRRNAFSCISLRLLGCVISSYSVNVVGHLKCVVPFSPDTMGYMGEKGGGIDNPVS